MRRSVVEGKLLAIENFAASCEWLPPTGKDVPYDKVREAYSRALANSLATGMSLRNGEFKGQPLSRATEMFGQRRGYLFVISRIGKLWLDCKTPEGVWPAPCPAVRVRAFHEDLKAEAERLAALLE